MAEFYTCLDVETRIIVQQRTNEIKALMRRTAHDIVAPAWQAASGANRATHSCSAGRCCWDCVRVVHGQRPPMQTV